jgi:asparagine synthase (glutamine-hydrolysing)
MRPQRYAAVHRGSPPGRANRADPSSDLDPRADRLIHLPLPGPVSVWIEAGCHAQTFSNGGGVILGSIFERDGTQPLTALPGWFERLAYDRWSDALSAHFWGGFVAIWTDGSDIVVSRDPSGAMPCYYIKSDGGIWFASDLDMLRTLGVASPAIDWDAVGSHAVAVQYRSSRTCLSGLSELLPGMAMRCDDKNATLQTHWSPWTFAKREAIQTDEIGARDDLRRAVVQVHQGWSRRVERPLVPISGGLDSSIVASALRLADIEVAGVTISTTEAAGDERPFARAMAARLDMPLREAFFEPHRIRLDVSSASSLPRPSARSFGQELDRLTVEAAEGAGADGILHGGGGDNVFCLLQSVAPILDRLAIHGIGGGPARTLLDVCRLTGAGAPAVGQSVMRRLLSGRRHYLWPIDTSFLHERVKHTMPTFDHPWLDPPPGTLSGSAAHIAYILAIQNYLDSHFQHPDLVTIAPLLSQPIVETCLRIPSWMWVAGGIDRAVARHAFADVLPPMIRDRRTKGSPDSVVTGLVADNRGQIRELLLDGLIARHAIVHAVAIDDALRSETPLSAEVCTRLLTLCDIEAWVRSATVRAADRC